MVSLKIFLWSWSLCVSTNFQILISVQPNQILSEELLGWENAALEFGLDHIKTLIAIDSLIVEPSFLAYLLHSGR